MFSRDNENAKESEATQNTLPRAKSSRRFGADKASNPSTTRSIAMIGQSIQIKGTITGNEDLVIEGTVEGSVNLPDNDLTIGEEGKVTADLAAKNINVEGQVTGDINGSEKVVVSKSGRVRGNIIAPRVTLEDGAKFKGSIDMDPGETNKLGMKVESKIAPVSGGKQEVS